MRYKFVAENIIKYNGKYTINKDIFLILAAEGVTFLVNFDVGCGCGACGFIRCYDFSNGRNELNAPREIFRTIAEEVGSRF